MSELCETTNDEVCPEQQSYNRKNIVAKWCISIKASSYCIELEHGKTSGRRIIWVNEKEILRRDWMFKLVGEVTFYIESVPCIIRVDPGPCLKYKYSLFIDGKSYDQYTHDYKKQCRLWLNTFNSKDYHIMLDLNTLNVYINNKLCSKTAEFVDGGTDLKFSEDGIMFLLKSRASGNNDSCGIVHTLLANGETVTEKLN